MPAESCAKSTWTTQPCSSPSPAASIFVPGYGLATAQAQHAVRELAELLEDRGVTVKYAIHPVAGRMPGHMNVLLAEANVPYSHLYEMEQINPEFPSTDVAVVIGANDVVNPDARDNPKSLIAGMPILEVDRAKSRDRAQTRPGSRLLRPGKSRCSSSPAPPCSTATPNPASPTWPRPSSTSESEKNDLGNMPKKKLSIGHDIPEMGNKAAFAGV